MKRPILASLVLLLALLCSGATVPFSFWKSASGGPPSPLIAHLGYNGGQNGGTSPAIVTTGANLIVVAIHYYAGGAASTSINDSKGNTYTARSVYGTGATAIRIYDCYNPTVGTGHTFTFGDNGTYSSITVTAWSGMAASPFDTENGGSTATSTTFASGSVTPSQANTLVIAAMTFDLGAPVVVAGISVNNGFTITDTVPYSYGNGEGASMAYKILTSSAATSATFTSDLSAAGVANITAYKY